MLGRGRDILPGAVSRPRALRAGERDLEVYIGVPPAWSPENNYNDSHRGDPHRSGNRCHGSCRGWE